MLHLLLIIFITAAPGAFALDLAPSMYAISVVGKNLCLGYYLAYERKTAGTSIYLVPSNTSQPPLWNVNPAPGGAGFQLTPAIRPFPTFAPEMLAYDPLSCFKTDVSFNYSPNYTWTNAGGFLDATGRGECPPGTPVRLAPLATTGAGRCRAVGLVPAIIQPDPAAAMWHFTEYPASPVELYTKGYGYRIWQWAESVAMDGDLVVEGTFWASVWEPTYWRRGAGGVWRRGNLKLPAVDACPPMYRCDDFRQVAIGDSFVALSVPLPGLRPKKPYWRIHVYDKKKLNGAPVATLTSPDAVRGLSVSLAAGGDNLALSIFPNKTMVFNRSKNGKWGAAVTLSTPQYGPVIKMSRDGRTLALSVFGEETFGDYEAINNGRVLVFRQAKAGETWVQEAEIQPPESLGINAINPAMALAGDSLAVSFSSNVTNLFFYRRRSSGAWKLVQSVTPPGEIKRLAGDGNTVVAALNQPPKFLVCKRNKATGGWAVGRPRSPPRWKDDFAQGSDASRTYGEMAVSGQRLAITAAFTNKQRSSPGVTFIYNNIDNM